MWHEVQHYAKTQSKTVATKQLPKQSKTIKNCQDCLKAHFPDREDDEVTFLDFTACLTGVNGCESSKILFFLYQQKIAWFDHFRNKLGGWKSIPEREPFQPFCFGNVRMHPCRPWWRFQSQSAISKIIEAGMGNSGFSEMMLTMSYFRYFTSICFLFIRYLCVLLCFAI